MKEVTPKAYCVAYTVVNPPALYQYLDDIQQGDWSSNAKTDSDKLLEVAGRICYRSFSPYDEDKPDGSNPNVTKVREDNTEYLQNTIKQAHGSILEHSNVTFIFHNVSRVFTHELVRHRAGMGYSQESLRYVRLNNLRFFLPREIKENPELYSLYVQCVQHLETIQNRLAKATGIEKEKNFHEKKKWTSRFRRLAPIGLATTIMATGNLRAWRHIVNMRSNSGAEEEIRLVMDQVVPHLKVISPAVFHDLNRNDEGIWEYGSNAKP